MYVAHILRLTALTLYMFCQLLTMSIKGTFGWSAKKYTTKIWSYTPEELTRHHHLKMARYWALCFGAAVALGGTGLGVAYTLRQMNIVRRKLRIIVSISVQRQWVVPRPRVRDFLLGLGIGILTLDIGLYGPLFIHCFVGEVVSAVSPHAAIMATAPMPGTDAFAGALHGAHDAMIMQGHTVNAGGFMPYADYNAMNVNAALQPGYAMGADATMGFEEAATRHAADAWLKRTAYSAVRA